MPEPILKCDGFDDCIIGQTNMPCTSQHRLIYSADKIIDKLVKEDDELTFTDALEYNIQSAYVGEGGPLFMWEILPEDDLVDIIESLEE